MNSLQRVQSRLNNLPVNHPPNFSIIMTFAAHYIGKPAPYGNFDPVKVILHGSPEQIEQAVNHCLQTRGQNCFIAAGCEIPDGTPLENLRAQPRALRRWNGQS